MKEVFSKAGEDSYVNCGESTRPNVWENFLLTSCDKYTAVHSAETSSTDSHKNPRQP